MGLRGFALYRYLVLPASLPAYVAGLKQGWAFAWRSLMAAELFVPIIGQFSIGQRSASTSRTSTSPRVSSMMIVILVIGIVVDTLFTKADLRDPPAPRPAGRRSGWSNAVPRRTRPG